MINRNETIDYIKGLAIISVISAHCNAVLDTTNQFAVLSSLLLQNIGTLGVICFFVISGMLFHHPEKNIGRFFKKKVTNIVIPWLISGAFVYLYVYLRKPPITLGGWINFVLGNGSYCYYLTVLMLLYIIFTLVPFMRKNAALLVCEGITVISTIWFYNIGGMNPYLNILNWIGYFALGVQISGNQEIWKKIKNGINKRFLAFCVMSDVCYVLVLIYQLYHLKGGGYWNGINVIACWFGAIALVLIAVRIENAKDNWFKRVIHQAGIESFGIYIWHMPVAGIIAHIMCVGVLNWMVLVRPIIVLIVVITAFEIAKKIMNRTKFCKYLKYLGIIV